MMDIKFKNKDKEVFNHLKNKSLNKIILKINNNMFKIKHLHLVKNIKEVI